MSSPVRTVTSEAERRAYDEERAYWLRNAESHFDEADLPFIRWHQRRVLENFALPEDELVLEVGAGAGKLLRDHPRVLVLDFSPEILRKAREVFPHYLAVCASVDALPFRDGSIRNLVANNMLHHVKGEGLLAPAAAEFERVVAPDGRLYVNDRNPALLHHAILTVTMAAKHALRVLFGEFPGCGSYNEPLFTRRDWATIESRFRVLRSTHYYTAAMWAVDSLAKGLFVILRKKDRGSIARMQLRALPALLRLERLLPFRALALERSVVAAKHEPGGAPGTPTRDERAQSTLSTPADATARTRYQ